MTMSIMMKALAARRATLRESPIANWLAHVTQLWSRFPRKLEARFDALMRACVGAYYMI